ncbi:MAG: [LysW]-aminoadipate/[LysW]-glutamate kinase [Nitrososphaeria archaeon]
MVTVVKVGGSLLKLGPPENILNDFSKALQEERLVLVHGGGYEVTEVAERLGKKQKFIISPNGMRSRYTDRETAEIYMMVMKGKINSEIVLALLGKGIRAIGLSGFDGGLLLAERKKKLHVIDERGRRVAIEGGYTGKITDVNSHILETLLREGYVPVISPVALGTEGEPLNVDGDRAAAYIAGRLKADRVVFLTDVGGVLIDGQLIKSLTIGEAKASLKRVGHGMDKKILAAVEALEHGAKESIISSGSVDNPITNSLMGESRTVIRI